MRLNITMTNKELPGNRRLPYKRKNTFQPGQSGNISGRPKLSEDLRRMKDDSLALVIELMYDTIRDRDYVASLKPSERLALIEVVGDRCGLYKTQLNEGGGADNGLARALIEALETNRRYEGLPPIIPTTAIRIENNGIQS